MVCIYCGSKTKITNSRHQKKANQTWRRHYCSHCGGIFTTVEAVDLPSSLQFRKALGHQEPFQRDKLFISVYEACRHRKDVLLASTALTATIISKLLSSIHNAGVEREQLVRCATEVLTRFDKAAGVQYAAYHPL